MPKQFVKSPLRFPGGKSKAITKILNYLPSGFSEYREPFIGGGSLFIYLKQIKPEVKFWINDLNYDLYCFWKQIQVDIDTLSKKVWAIKQGDVSGREIFKQLTSVDLNDLSDFERAVRFFVLNRISFSGTVDCGGFSQTAFEKRFTDSSIVRLSALGKILQGTKITNLDYSEVLSIPGDDVFIFLDPPYFTATKSRLYGKRGDLHTSFDHQKFAQELKRCQHKWLITYDDSPEIRRNFKFANIYEWEMQYGMNNYMQDHALKGKELFITNFELPTLQPMQLVIPGLSC